MSMLASRRAARPRPRDCGGFSLIEIIAVLVIIALLATVVAESILTRIRESARRAEAASLSSIVDVLRRYTARTHCIAGPSNWTNVLSAELSLPPAKVLLNGLGFRRLFLADPTLRVGTNTTAVVLPYVQTNVGSLQPQNPRFLLVSSLAGELPSISTNDAAAFNAMWNTVPDGVPTNFPSSWSTKGRDIKIERVDFRGLFHRVVFNNMDPANVARYSVETTNALATVPVSQSREVWYLDGTQLNFHFASGGVQGSEILHEDASYVHENGGWRRYVQSGQGAGTGNFAALIEAYLACQEPSYPKFYATKQAFVNDLYTYLWSYAIWALGGFNYDMGGGSQEQTPDYRLLIDCRDRLDDISDNLTSDNRNPP